MERRFETQNALNSASGTIWSERASRYAATCNKRIAQTTATEELPRKKACTSCAASASSSSCTATEVPRAPADENFKTALNSASGTIWTERASRYAAMCNKRIAQTTATEELPRKKHAQVVLRVRPRVHAQPQRFRVRQYTKTQRRHWLIHGIILHMQCRNSRPRVRTVRLRTRVPPLIGVQLVCSETLLLRVLMLRRTMML